MFLHQFLLIVLLLFLNTSFSQNWEVTHVDQNGDASVELRIDARNDEIHVLAKGSFNKLFYYYSSDHGTTWTKNLLGEITHRTFEVGEIASLIDHHGTYHIAYFSKSNDIVHARKTSNATWIRDTLLHNNETYRDPWHRIFLDIDSENKLHAFFKDNSIRKYFYQTDAGWIEKSVNIAQTSLHEYTFDLDKNNVAHVVCNNYDEQLFHFYSKDNGTTWKSEPIGNFNADGNLAMKTDSKGNPHIVFTQEEDFFRGKTEVEICTYLRKDNNGVWEKIVLEKANRPESQKDESHTFYNHIPSIDVDEKDGIHIAYLPGENSDFHYPVGDTIVYAYMEAGSSTVVYRGVPFRKEFYPGVCVRATNNTLYYGYIGSSDAITNSRGIELFTTSFSVEKEQDTTLPASRKTEIQAKINLSNPDFLIELWDNGEEDGDILTILINDLVFNENIKLLNEHQQIPVQLKSGATYIISIVAVSEGLYPPCTAVVVIKDGESEHVVTITSDASKNGSIQLVVQ